MKRSTLQSVAFNANQSTQDKQLTVNTKKAIKRKLSSSCDKENINPSPITETNKPKVTDENQIKLSNIPAVFYSVLHEQESSYKKKKITKLDELAQVSSLEYELMNLGTSIPDVDYTVARQSIKIDPFLSVTIEKIANFPEDVQLKVSELHDLFAESVVKDHHLSLIIQVLNAKKSGQSCDSMASIYQNSTIEELLIKIQIILAQRQNIYDLKIKKIQNILNLIEERTSRISGMPLPNEENEQYVWREFQRKIMTESLSCQKHTFKASETKPKLQTTAVVEKGQVIKEITAAAVPKQANTLPSSNLNKKLTKLKSDNKKSKKSKKNEITSSSSEDETMSFSKSLSSSESLLSSSNELEKLYCTCKEHRMGTMIQCFNENACKIEWYHLECVNLKLVPKGKWLCNRCIKTKKQKLKN